MTDHNDIPLDPQGVRAATDAYYNSGYLPTVNESIAYAIRAYLSHAQPRAGVTGEDVENARRNLDREMAYPLAHSESAASLYVEHTDGNTGYVCAVSTFRRILAALIAAPALTREQEDAVIRRRVGEVTTADGDVVLYGSNATLPKTILAALGVTREGE